MHAMPRRLPACTRRVARVLCSVLLPCAVATASAWAQRAEPLLQSPACAQARAALDEALAAHSRSDPATTRSLARARVQAQRECLGNTDATVLRERSTTDAPLRVPRIVVPPATTAPAAAALPSPLPPPAPRVLGPCDATGCWDNQGRRLNEGGGIYSSPGGGVCSVQGSFATCP
jgi:hypothetical protein